MNQRPFVSQPQSAMYSGEQVNIQPRGGNFSGNSDGLLHLVQLDKIFVRQKVSLKEVLIGWEANNKYSIMNEAGQEIYYAFEQTDTCMRVCCGPQRSFLIHIVDPAGQEVLKVSRQFKCCAGCCWCAGSCDGCAHEVEISTANNEQLGFVKQKGSCWKGAFDILDEQRNQLLSITGPCCICDGACCPCDNEFKVVLPDGITQVGSVSKVYSGFVREMTKADNFTISFPIDTPIKTKATLLGALFLIDFMYFEQNKQSNSDSSG